MCSTKWGRDKAQRNQLVSCYSESAVQACISATWLSKFKVSLHIYWDTPHTSPHTQNKKGMMQLSGSALTCLAFAREKEEEEVVLV